MKKNIYIILFFNCLFNLAVAQKVTLPFPKVLNVAVFVYPGVGLGDLQGPVDVFTKAGSITKGQYKVYTVALDTKAIRTQGGTLQITPDYTPANMPRADILVIPGGSVGLADSMRYNPAVLSFIDKCGKDAEVLMSVCTAAYFVAQTGAFEGRKVTTHFFQADDLQLQFPKAIVIRNVRFVDEGRLVTASGVTSGIDASLHLVGRFSGEQTEKMVEGAIQYVMHERETWPQPIGGMKFDRKRRENMGLLRKED